MKKSDLLSVIAIIISIVALGVVLFGGSKCIRPKADFRGGEMMQRQGNQDGKMMQQGNRQPNGPRVAQ